MARDGSGSYSNPYPNFVNGTVISSDEADANNAAIATALTQSIAVDGQTTITANLPMNSKKFTGLAAGTAATDSLTLGQAQAQAFAWGGTAGGSADAITIAPTPAITAYAVGQKFFWIASGSANTGAATIAISGLSAIAMQDGGAALAAGVHAAGKVYMGVLSTTSTCQIMQVQSSGDPLVISGLTVNGTADITGTTTVVALTASGLVTAGANVDMNGTELILDADADTSITADTDDTIDIRIAGADDFQFTANTFTAQSGSTIAAQALTATTVTASDIVTANAKLDLNGTELILDVDANTSITADTDDTIDIRIAGADDFQFTANDFTALSGSVISTNTIAETTAASGVTIDGLLIKDSTAAFADGAVATPSITNTGDLNTGVYFPAADTVGVVTGGVEKFRFGSNPIPGKNLIINGAMTVAQRGASFTALTDAYCLDRWVYTKDATTAVIDVTQSADVPSGEGFGKSVKIDVTTADASIAAGDLARFQTRLEAQNLTQLKYGSAGAQTMTLSFWIKSTKTGTFGAFVFQADGSRFYNASYTVNVTNTWEYKTVTITGDSGGTINDDTGTGLIVGWTLIAGTNFTGSADTWSGNSDYAASSYSMLDSTSNDIFITGVQLEVGSVATDFAHQSYAEDLAACQRYLYLGGTGASGGASSTSQIILGWTFPEEMRAAPTAALIDTSISVFNTAGSGLTSSGSAIDYSSIKKEGALTRINGWSGGNAQVQHYVVIVYNNDPFITFSAEL